MIYTGDISNLVQRYVELKKLYDYIEEQTSPNDLLEIKALQRISEELNQMLVNIAGFGSSKIGLPFLEVDKNIKYATSYLYEKHERLNNPDPETLKLREQIAADLLKRLNEENK